MTFEQGESKLGEKNWYAVYTRSRNEKKVHKLLTDQHIDSFLPLYKSLRQWSDRKKLVELPLFTSYVFVNINIKQSYYVLCTDGVVKFVSFENKPAVIPDYQIENLKILIHSHHKFDKTSVSFEKGQKVMVNYGSLKGLIGELIRLGRKNRILIRIEHLFQNILVHIPSNHLDHVQ